MREARWRKSIKEYREDKETNKLVNFLQERHIKAFEQHHHEEAILFLSNDL
jgi:hypothetical protein